MDMSEGGQQQEEGGRRKEGLGRSDNVRGEGRMVSKKEWGSYGRKWGHLHCRNGG